METVRLPDCLQDLVLAQQASHFGLEGTCTHLSGGVQDEHFLGIATMRRPLLGFAFGRYQILVKLSLLFRIRGLASAQ